MRTFETLATSVSVPKATPADFDLMERSYDELIDVAVKFVIGAGTVSCVFTIQGSHDKVTWFDLHFQDLTATSLTYALSKTLTANKTASLLRCVQIMPYMRVYVDNSGSDNAVTVTLLSSGL